MVWDIDEHGDVPLLALELNNQNAQRTTHVHHAEHHVQEETILSSGDAFAGLHLSTDDTDNDNDTDAVACDASTCALRCAVAVTAATKTNDLGDLDGHGDRLGAPSTARNIHNRPTLLLLGAVIMLAAVVSTYAALTTTSTTTTTTATTATATATATTTRTPTTTTTTTTATTGTTAIATTPTTRTTTASDPCRSPALGWGAGTWEKYCDGCCSFDSEQACGALPVRGGGGSDAVGGRWDSQLPLFQAEEDLRQDLEWWPYLNAVYRNTTLLYVHSNA